jgi:hypothetical protein
MKKIQAHEEGVALLRGKISLHRYYTPPLDLKKIEGIEDAEKIKNHGRDYNSIITHSKMAVYASYSCKPGSLTKLLQQNLLTRNAAYNAQSMKEVFKK